QAVVDANKHWSAVVLASCDTPRVGWRWPRFPAFCEESEHDERRALTSKNNAAATRCSIYYRAVREHSFDRLASIADCRILLTDRRFRNGIKDQEHEVATGKEYRPRRRQSGPRHKHGTRNHATDRLRR